MGATSLAASSTACSTAWRARCARGSSREQLAIVSDIHGNLEALEAVLADLDHRGLEHVACLGDFVGYGASPNECIDMLRPRIEIAVAGNHDLAASGRIKLGYFNPTRRRPRAGPRQRCGRSCVTWLHGAAHVGRVARGAAGARHARATPRSGTTCSSPNDAAIEMATCAEPVCFIGHSHRAATFDRGARSRDAAHARTASSDVRASATW